MNEHQVRKQFIQLVHGQSLLIQTINSQYCLRANLWTLKDLPRENICHSPTWNRNKYKMSFSKTVINAIENKSLIIVCFM